MVEDRKLAVLRAIVEDYVSTQEPVGSKTLVERHQLGVSPATVRNDMAALEEEGFIAQPHTSAGRIPTEKGYRLTWPGKARGRLPDLVPGLKPDELSRAVATAIGLQAGMTAGVSGDDKVDYGAEQVRHHQREHREPDGHTAENQQRHVGRKHVPLDPAWESSKAR